MEGSEKLLEERSVVASKLQHESESAPSNRSEFRMGLYYPPYRLEVGRKLCAEIGDALQTSSDAAVLLQGWEILYFFEQLLGGVALDKLSPFVGKQRR